MKRSPGVEVGFTRLRLQVQGLGVGAVGFFMCGAQNLGFGM